MAWNQDTNDVPGKGGSVLQAVIPNGIVWMPKSEHELLKKFMEEQEQKIFAGLWNNHVVRTREFTKEIKIKTKPTRRKMKKSKKIL